MKASTLSQALSKDFPKQVSQDNIAVFSIERVAEYLASLLGVGSQLLHIAKGLNSFLTVPTSPSPFNQINNVDVCPSYSL